MMTTLGHRWARLIALLLLVAAAGCAGGNTGTVTGGIIPCAALGYPGEPHYAAGIVTGRGLGASATAALTTRGFAELVRFGKAVGAKTETMMGLSGLGDLILTCSTPQSRNFSCGVALGKGEKPDQNKLAEGVFTAPALLEMAMIFVKPAGTVMLSQPTTAPSAFSTMLC